MRTTIRGEASWVIRRTGSPYTEMFHVLVDGLKYQVEVGDRHDVLVEEGCEVEVRGVLSVDESRPCLDCATMIPDSVTVLSNRAED